VSDGQNSKKIISLLVVFGGIANIVVGAFYFTKMSLDVLITGTALIWGVNSLVLSPGRGRARIRRLCAGCRVQKAA